jgi:hypothetical protein
VASTEGFARRDRELICASGRLHQKKSHSRDSGKSSRNSSQDEDVSVVVYCRGTKPEEKTLPEEGITAEATNSRNDIAGRVLADLQFSDLELSARQLSTVRKDIRVMADEVA